jgi:hypothetical protein
MMFPKTLFLFVVKSEVSLGWKKKEEEEEEQ